MTDQDLLRIVGDERRRSIGFENDATLTEERTRALRFIKGDMSQEVPSLPMRSKAVSMDIADAIQTLLPDLIEIFIGDGEDVVAFVPQSQEDEEAAEQETDYISYVMFQQNRGFLWLYTMFSDALSQKTGIVKYWWESEPAKEEVLEGVTAEALHMAVRDGELTALEPEQPEDGIEPHQPTFNATLQRPRSGRVSIRAVAPEDFTVAADTIELAETTYCAHRTRERAQDLIARGIPKATVDKLEDCRNATNEVDLARDTAGEHETPWGSDSNGPLRQVEIIEHYVRVLDGKEIKLWRVQTNRDETVFIEKAQVERIPFAAITPYIVTHRFYGQSVADLLTEIQMINTTLTRMALDSGYFALNQRAEVATNGANENTLSDLMRNEPGVPIRSTSGNAVRLIGGGELGFDVFGALEFFSTKSEQRTGIVRNAQGLNPDTLHDTAKGAAALMAAAMKRMRMIARIFAETGIKDLYLGVHALILENAEEHRKGVVRLRNGWKDIDPSTWAERADMRVEVGIGAGGKEVELASLERLAGMFEQVIGVQGGMNGPVIKADGVYNLLKRIASKSGIKQPESFLSDPAKERPAEGPPPPDPVMLELEAKMKLQGAELQGKQQLEAQRLQADARRAENDLTIQREKMAMEHQFKTEQADRDHQFKAAQAAEELQLKREEMQMQAQIKIETAHLTAAASQVSATVDGPHMGGEPG